MIQKRPSLFLLPVAVLVLGSSTTVDDLDLLRDLSLDTHATTQGRNIYNENKRTGGKQFNEKGAVLTNCLTSLATVGPSLEVSTPARHSRFRDVRDSNLLEPACDSNSLRDDVVSSRVVAAVSSSISIMISSARESARHAINAAKANTSFVAESSSSTVGSNSSSVVRASSTARNTSSTVESISYAAESTSLVGGGSNRVSHGVNFDAGQFAGIVVGVFLVSSLSSILAMLYIIRYRRRRANAMKSTVNSPVEAKRQMRWPVGDYLRGHTIRSKYPTTAISRQPSEIFARMPHPNVQNAPVSQSPFISPISPGSTSQRIHSISPLSDKQHGDPGRDRSPSLELGIFRDNAQEGSEYEERDVPPIRFTLARNATQSGAQQMQVVRVGGQEMASRHMLSNRQTTKQYLSHDRASDSATPRRAPSMQHSIHRRGRSAVNLAPIANINTMSPPVIPLRFSSLNAYRSSQQQSAASFHGDDGTFLLTTDEESIEHVPGPLQNQPEPRSSHSSITSRDLTQLNPSGPDQQPVSRFSISSAPASVDYSVSSTSPVQPEISPLSPAPLSPSQLWAPVPRRPNTAANVGVHGTFYT
ncbi:hypothetical protein GGR55DRAFT_203833 [Xylaria sp. FL0064]|nr:hypothetical protein GGR55DRAFT_203833 [Xylaria sp. FL0064]